MRLVLISQLKRVPVIDNRRVEDMERMYNDVAGNYKVAYADSKICLLSLRYSFKCLLVFYVQSGLGIRFKDYV